METVFGLKSRLNGYRSSFLTVLHDPQRPDEVRRIEKSISRVLW
ncbi:hypothetical protein BHMPCIPO_04695 [Ensifer sesbaniae]|nr:hypothetical protein [Ensifer sesbaniae]